MGKGKGKIRLGLGQLDKTDRPIRTKGTDARDTR